jgi:NitT/TauT family transport system substrate-binding protein
MAYDRRTFTAGLAGLTFFATFPRAAGAQQVERSSLSLGVANKAHLYYLPLTLAERRGHFKDYGLTIAISDFEGGGRYSLRSRIGRRRAGAYEQRRARSGPKGQTSAQSSARPVSESPASGRIGHPSRMPTLRA